MRAVCTGVPLDVKSVGIELLDIKRSTLYYLDIKRYGPARTADRQDAESREEITVDAFTPYLAEIHRQELLDEAEATRLANAARTSGGIPAWRRTLGSLFASAAGTLDPSIDTTIASPSSDRSSGSRWGARGMAS
jgi:hypothetical protein